MLHVQDGIHFMNRKRLQHTSVKCGNRIMKAFNVCGGCDGEDPWLLGVEEGPVHSATLIYCMFLCALNNLNK